MLLFCFVLSVFHLLFPLCFVLCSLVFVKYNQTLKEHHKNDEYIDPVIVDDHEINAGSEWLLGDQVCCL